MADNFTILQSTGATVVLRAKDINGTSSTYATMTIPTDQSGNAMVSSGATFTSTAQSAQVVVVSSLSPARLVTLSSNPTVIPSSVYTVTLSSNPTVIPSSVYTVTLSSNPTITSVTSGAITIIGGAAGANTANVLAGSSTVTSTMSALVVAISSNGAGVIGTGTPSTPSSQYISAVVVGDLALAGSNSSASNPVPLGGTAIVNSYMTAVSSFQRSAFITDPVGRQITAGSARLLRGSQVTSVSSTTETNVVTASSLFFQDLYGCVISNPSSQTITVTIKDSSGGTTRMVMVVPTADTRGFWGPESAAMPQTTSSAAWTVTLGSVPASALSINMYFVKTTA